MKALEQGVRALLHAAQQERKAAPGRGRVGTASQAGDQAMLRAKELLAAAPRLKCSPSPAESRSTPTGPSPSQVPARAGGGARGGAAPQPQDGPWPDQQQAPTRGLLYQYQ